jgi:hypothetical protein
MRTSSSGSLLCCAQRAGWLGIRRRKSKRNNSLACLVSLRRNIWEVEVADPKDMEFVRNFFLIATGSAVCRSTQRRRALARGRHIAARCRRCDVACRQMRRYVDFPHSRLPLTFFLEPPGGCQGACRQRLPKVGPCGGRRRRSRGASIVAGSCRGGTGPPRPASSPGLGGPPEGGAAVAPCAPTTTPSARSAPAY